MSLFLLTVLSVYLGMHLFAWLCLYRQSRFSRHILWTGIILCFPLSLSLVFTHLIPQSWPQWLIRLLWETAYFWLGFVLYMVVLQIPAQLLEIGTRIYFPNSTARVREVCAIFIVPLALAVLSLGYYSAAQPPKIVRYNIYTEKKCPALKIAFVADNHLGIQTPFRQTQNLVHVLKKENPDLCIFGGDLSSDHPNLIQKHLKLIRSVDFPQGKFAVRGNHEIYMGKQKAEKKIHTAGINLLENSVVSLCGGSLQLAGLEDPARNKDERAVFQRELKGLLQKTDRNQFTIVVTHRPLGMDIASKAGVDLQVSGHTHKGQLFPFGFLVRLVYPHIHGKYSQNGTKLIVTSGYGTWGPSARVFTRREINMIAIRPQNQGEQK